jgi:hypothetical protein
LSSAGFLATSAWIDRKKAQLAVRAREFDPTVAHEVATDSISPDDPLRKLAVVVTIFARERNRASAGAASGSSL